MRSVVRPAGDDPRAAGRPEAAKGYGDGGYWENYWENPNEKLMICVSSSRSLLTG